MLSKTTFVLALFAVSKLAMATPPACLLAAVNEQPDPSDLQSICGSKAGDVKSFLSDNCGSFTSEAMSAFKETCSEAGYTVSVSTSSSKSSSASKTGGSSHATGTGSGHGYGNGYTTVPLSSGYAAPTGYSVVATSTYYDTSCSCTKTAAIAFTGTPGGYASGTGMATATYAATGSSNGTYSATGTSTASPSSFSGAADRTSVGSFLGVAGLVALLAL